MAHSGEETSIDLNVDDYADIDSDEEQVAEYEITATPNDFNVLTLNSFIEAGAVKIPGFQRNFVWDLGRASKLIESLILGLPVPQLFLYEQSRNKFQVIDGQQRLMSIYYFIKKRFPRKEKRSELRQIFDEHGSMPPRILADDAYFQPFNLLLKESLPAKKNRFKNLNYDTLGEYQTSFNLRPIRNIVVKQNSPDDGDSAIFEVFNRLNTGGVNLRPQEIRTSMYHSAFYDMLYSVNTLASWRRVLGTTVPDLHMKDIEIIIRGFAMLTMSSSYAPSMVRFLNRFSKSCIDSTPADNEYLEHLFHSFLVAAESLPDDIFVNKKNNRFNIALYEATFTAACSDAYEQRRIVVGQLDEESVRELSVDPAFVAAAAKGTTGSSNVDTRLQRARAIVAAL